MNCAGRKEDVDAWARGIFQGAPCRVDVIAITAREACDDRTTHLASHKIHRFPVAPRGDRKAGFDDVDAKFRKRLRHAQLLRLRHAAARRLLAVAERGVKDEDAIGVGHRPISTYPTTTRHRRSSPRRSRRRSRGTAPAADTGTAAG